MAELFKNLASTTLDGAHDDTTTSIAVVSAMGFTVGTFRILVDSEIMKVTSVSGNTFTVSRAQEGTAAASHLTGAPVYHVLTAGALDAHDQNDLAAYDTYANRPAAGTPGRIFLPTDGIFLERDNGASWDKFGPIWPMTPPLTTDFPTWVNQVDATFTDSKGAPYMVAPYTTSDSLRCCVKAYPAPPFTVEMAFYPNTWAVGLTNGFAMGLIIRDSVSGKMQVYGVGGGYTSMEFIGTSYTNYTTLSGWITGWPGQRHFSDTPLFWIKYYDDNASARVISFSVDGYTWTQTVSLSRTDFVTPNQIGVSINTKSGYGSSGGSMNVGAAFLHWKQY